MVTIGERTQPLGETTRYFTTDKNQEINTMQDTGIQSLRYFFGLNHKLLIINYIQGSASANNRMQLINYQYITQCTIESKKETIQLR